MSAAPFPKITMDWLEERCTRTEEGCLVWKLYIAALDGRDRPMSRPTKDSRPYQVRRLVWQLKKKAEPTRTDCIYRTCDTWGCVWCIAKRGPADALKGRKLSLDHRARIAQRSRARGLTDLTLDVARQIRASSLPNEKEAALRKVSPTTVAEIRRNTRWREYGGNPFAQLLP